MSSAKFVNIARLITTYNFEIEQLPENLKCAQCEFVLKDACQVSCGCRFCRVCIDDMVASGIEFCPRDLEDCSETLLSTAAPDYRANKNVSKLTVKCAHDGCAHKCQLGHMEEHLRECQRKTEECPFCELGCTKDKLAAEEIGRHLQLESRSHSEILIEMIANINREVSALKQRDEDTSRTIDMLKQRDEERGREIEVLKHELVLKDGQIRSITDQLIHIENENKSIAREKADLADRVTILTEKLDQEIDERRENDELDSARVIDHVDREIAAVKRLIDSNKNKFVSDIKSIRDFDIETVNQSTQSTKDDVCSLKSAIRLIKMLVGMGWISLRYEFLINTDVVKTHWSFGERLSDFFTGEDDTYKFQLTSNNSDSALMVFLNIYQNGQLWYPFKRLLVITVADRDMCGACMSQSVECQIENIEYNKFKKSEDRNKFKSEPVTFFHSELRRAGLNLRRGIRISCIMQYL